VIHSFIYFLTQDTPFNALLAFDCLIPMPLRSIRKITEKQSALMTHKYAVLVDLEESLQLSAKAVPQSQVHFL